MDGSGKGGYGGYLSAYDAWSKGKETYNKSSKKGIGKGSSSGNGKGPET